MKQILFTKKGYEDKQKEYEELLASRPAAVKDLARAREMGDLSENGYYKSARFKLSDIDRNLRQLKHLLKIAKVHENMSNNIIDIGSTATLQLGNTTKTYAIVGTYEANPSSGAISSSSPLGRILLGKKVGDKGILIIGENQTPFSILKIQ